MATVLNPNDDPPLVERLDRVLTELRAGEKAWAETPLAGRAQMLSAVHRLVVAHAADWVDAAVAIKGLDPSPLVGEEWISGPWVTATNAATLAHALGELARGRSPLRAARFGTAPGGRTTVQVLPTSVWDRLLLNGYSAEVWLEPGVTAGEARLAAGLAQRTPGRTGGIGLVLGAGNITSIAPLDVLYELIAHNRVVVLKPNPITDPLVPVWELVLAPLIDAGVLRIVMGGADVGSALIQHADIAHVHMTGSSQTHDAIVFGTGEAGADRKASGQPLLNKPVTSELGGVSPVIVLGDRWSDADLKYQAAHVATQRLHNGGYNCVASQLVVLPAGWPLKDRFLAELRHAVHDAPPRVAYYPGSDDRVARALGDYPAAVRLGRQQERVFITGLQEDSCGPLIDAETFSPVLGVVELPYAGQEFLRRAAAFVNDKVSGTLGINVLAHPRVIAGIGQAFDEFLASLRYGTVAVNAWTGVGYLTATATWGAYPGHTITDVQSGIGVVHNALLIDRSERTVVRGPFRPLPRSVMTGELSISPKPPWFVDNRTAAATGRLLVDFVGRPSAAKLPAIFASALRG